MRGRSYSYSTSPPRYHSRRRRSPSPRDRYGGRGKDLPTSLLVRNLRHDCRPDDLREPFGEFGPLKDVYLPRDYHTGEPRGFGFVQYLDPYDAAEAKYQMDGQILLGRELTVVFAEENRKKPSEMRARHRLGVLHMIEGSLPSAILVHLTMDSLMIAVQVIIPLPLGEDATLGQSRLVTIDIERGHTLVPIMVRAELAVQSGVGAGA